MSATGFDRALEFTLKWEGGYVNHPADPGGATNKGIIQRVYDAYRKQKGLPLRTVREITSEELHEIYLVKYWKLMGCDALPFPLDAVTFDIGVNHGPGRAKEFLAKAKLNMDDDDSNDNMELARRMIDLRVNFYYAIVARRPSQKVFLKGWLNRARDQKRFMGY